jgi:FkbH-like protein
MILGMLSFLELKKISKQQNSVYPVYKLAVMGDCATQHLATALKGFAYTQEISLKVLDTDYNQIEAQILDTASELYAFTPDSVLLFMCAEKLYETYTATPEQERQNFAETICNKISFYWQTISTNCKTRILQYNFTELDDGVFGSYANKVASSFLFQERKLNYLLAVTAQKYKNVFLADLASIQTRMGRNTFADSKLFFIAKMSLSLEALPFAAKSVIDIIKNFLGQVKKCVVCDLDNTLWGGVIGDDGLQGIQIGELGTGHAFSELQTWLKELKKRGILLAVCSKNEEAAAKEPFLKHPEMVLHLDDISIFVANWLDKASNIRYIQKTLNIGMDSMVFLDDNPFERNLVRSMIPEITVPDLPEDPADYLTFLRSLNLFETTSFSSEDCNRTSQYQAEVQRTETQKVFTNYDDYLHSLEMVATVKPFDSFQFPRIAQLTQRSNQFNLRTIRYTEAEVENLAKNDRYITRYFMLRDKFGDHGLVSVLVMEKQPETKTLFVTEWLMSCRVLKRGMEEFIINTMIDIAKRTGFDHVTGEYIKTPKNAMVEKIYSNLGFTETGNGRFIADIAAFKPNRTFIHE